MTTRTTRQAARQSDRQAVAAAVDFATAQNSRLRRSPEVGAGCGCGTTGGAEGAGVRLFAAAGLAAPRGRPARASRVP